ncbi:hypothetical protein [Arthrobacter sp.]|nr:hypothetical protein [Arthrobacter sp.]
MSRVTLESQRIVAASCAGATQRACSAFGIDARFAGVSITLGSTQSTVTP